MQKFTAVLIMQIIFQSVLAQDSTQVTYSQELDTLVNQRFIDRYENVFLTKVPTRHLVKFGFANLSGSPFQTNKGLDDSYQIGYEYKLFPVISVGVSATMDQLFPYESTTHTKKNTTYSVGGVIRWYYDMGRRMREGKNANNFNGNYFALVADNFIRFDEPEENKLTKIGIEFGIQRRIRGAYVVLGIGSYYQNYSSAYFQQLDNESGNNISDITLSTHSSFGIAYYDWKRTDKAPNCDILTCDEIVTHQFKILWPNINISKNITSGSLHLAFEQKLAKSPISINAQMLANYSNYRFRGNPTTGGDNLFEENFQIQPSLQMRYYFLQKRQIKKGTGGNNLSGLYFGPYSDYIKYGSKSLGLKSVNEHLGLGLIAGFQVTLLRNFYTEFYFAESWNVLNTKPDVSSAKGSLRLGFGFVL